MTKAEYIALFRHKLSGGNMTPDLEGKYHPEIVSRYIGMAFNTLLREVYKTNGSIDVYAKNYKNIEILEDTELDIKYSVLDQSPIQLPKGSGIMRISPMQDPSITFKYVTDRAKSVLMRADVGLVGTNTWYTVSGDRIEYYSVPLGITKVLIRMITPFQQLEDTDEFPIPSGMDDALFKMVQSYFGQNIPEDDTNDNSSKQI